MKAINNDCFCSLNVSCSWCGKKTISISERSDLTPHWQAKEAPSASLFRTICENTSSTMLSTEIQCGRCSHFRTFSFTTRLCCKSFMTVGICLPRPTLHCKQSFRWITAVRTFLFLQCYGFHAKCNQTPRAFFFGSLCQLFWSASPQKEVHPNIQAKLSLASVTVWYSLMTNVSLIIGYKRPGLRPLLYRFFPGFCCCSR